MSDVTSAPPEYQMSARARRRFIIALFTTIVLLFAGGSLAFLLDFRHHNICAGGAQWVSRTDDPVGGVTYVCPDGKTVTEGLLPLSDDARGVRDWWLRTLLVLQAPRPVFAALRDDSEEAASDRSEPILAIVVLAGAALALTSHAAESYSGALLGVWMFVAGGITGAAAYFVFGLILFWAAQKLGSAGSFRRARHVLAFASVPLVASLALWPVRAAVYRGHVFHGGHAVFTPLSFVFVAWSAVLLIVGVRAVHGWSWARAALAAALPIAAAGVLLAL